MNVSSWSNPAAWFPSVRIPSAQTINKLAEPLRRIGIDPQRAPTPSGIVRVGQSDKAGPANSRMPVVPVPIRWTCPSSVHGGRRSRERGQTRSSPRYSFCFGTWVSGPTRFRAVRSRRHAGRGVAGRDRGGDQVWSADLFLRGDHAMRQAATETSPPFAVYPSLVFRSRKPAPSMGRSIVPMRSKEVDLFLAELVSRAESYW